MRTSQLLFFLCLISFSPIRGEALADTKVSFDNGIRFKEDSGLYDVRMRFRTQLLAQYESGLEGRTARLTTQPRRARFRLGGSLVDERLRFNFQLSFTRGDQDWDNTKFPNVVRDAAVMFKVLPNLDLVFGQTKLPGNRQRVISSGDLQFIDRSIVNRAFNIDRDFGLQAVLTSFQEEPSSTDPIGSIRAAVSGGGGRNTGSRVATSNAITMRGELLPFGRFTRDGDYFEGDLEREEAPKLSIGVGLSRFRDADRAGGPIGQPLLTSIARRTFTTYIADGVFKYQGFSVYVEYIRKQFHNWAPALADFDTSATGTISDYQSPLDGVGLNAQTGFYFDSAWEVVARYSVVTPESRTVSVFANQNMQYTLGVNRYFSGHRVKVQTDASYNQFLNTLSLARTQNWIARFQVELGI